MHLCLILKLILNQKYLQVISHFLSRDIEFWHFTCTTVVGVLDGGRRGAASGPGHDETREPTAHGHGARRDDEEQAAA